MKYSSNTENQRMYQQSKEYGMRNEVTLKILKYLHVCYFILFWTLDKLYFMAIELIWNANGKFSFKYHHINHILVNTIRSLEIKTVDIPHIKHQELIIKVVNVYFE